MARRREGTHMAFVFLAPPLFPERERGRPHDHRRRRGKVGPLSSLPSSEWREAEGERERRGRKVPLFLRLSLSWEERRGVRGVDRRQKVTSTSSSRRRSLPPPYPRSVAFLDFPFLSLSIADFLLRFCRLQWDARRDAIVCTRGKFSACPIEKKFWGTLAQFTRKNDEECGKNGTCLFSHSVEVRISSTSLSMLL